MFILIGVRLQNSSAPVEISFHPAKVERNSDARSFVKRILHYIVIYSFAQILIANYRCLFAQRDENISRK